MTPEQKEEFLRRLREEEREPTPAELAEARAYLAQLTPAELQIIEEQQQKNKKDASHCFAEADSFGDEPSYEAQLLNGEGDAALSENDEWIFENDVRRARIAKDRLSWHALLNPPPKTPEEIEQQRLKWEEFYRWLDSDLARRETRSGRNNRYRAKLAAADPKRAAVERAKKNLKSAEARLQKALARVAQVEREASGADGPYVAAHASVYLPEARKIVPDIEETVKRWRAALSIAEQALKG